MRRTWIIGMLALASVATGCVMPAGQSDEAERIVGRLHQALIDGDPDAALSLYGKPFFRETPRELWRERLRDLLRRHGRLRKAEKRFQQKDAHPSGDYYIFGYRLIFERGAVDETVTVGREVIGEDRLAIFAHLLREKGR